MPYFPHIPQILEWCEQESSKLARTVEWELEAKRKSERRQKEDAEGPDEAERGRVHTGLRKLSDDLKAKESERPRADRREMIKDNWRMDNDRQIREYRDAGLEPPLAKDGQVKIALSTCLLFGFTIQEVDGKKVLVPPVRPERAAE